MPTTHDATASQRLKSAPASPRRGLLTVLLGPQPLPLSVGIAVATAFISIETPLVHWFRHTGSANGALFLLGVLVVSAAGGFGLAVATTLVSALIYFYFHVARDGSFVVNGRACKDVPAIAAALLTGLMIAGYTVIDGVGVMHTPVLAYTGWLFLLQGPPIAVLALIRRGRRLADAMRVCAVSGVAGGAISLAAYAIVLWAQTSGALAPIAALRETSIVFGALIGAVFPASDSGHGARSRQRWCSPGCCISACREPLVRAASGTGDLEDEVARARVRARVPEGDPNKGVLIFASPVAAAIAMRRRT